MGGESHPACHTSSEMYDPKTEKWTALADMSTPRSGAGAAVLDNKIYIAGGHDRQTHHSSMECYDPHTNTWKSCANMNYSCSGIAITSLGKFLYAFGGRNRFAQVCMYVENCAYLFMFPWKLIQSHCTNIDF